VEASNSCATTMIFGSSSFIMIVFPFFLFVLCHLFCVSIFLLLPPFYMDEVTRDIHSLKTLLSYGVLLIPNREKRDRQLMIWIPCMSILFIS
jgi:hypothetical protein